MFSSSFISNRAVIMEGPKCMCVWAFDAYRVQLVNTKRPISGLGGLIIF